VAIDWSSETTDGYNARIKPQIGYETLGSKINRFDPQRDNTADKLEKW